jgi:hypothetical protein
MLAAKISALLFSLALTTSMPTGAGIPVIDGTNLTQNIVAAIENTSQTLKQIQEYQTQLQQYQNMLQNTMDQAVNIWDDAMTTMNYLRGAIHTLNYYNSSFGVQIAIRTPPLGYESQQKANWAMSERMSAQLVYDAHPNVSSGNAMIVPGSSFRCGFVIELIA